MHTSYLEFELRHSENHRLGRVGWLRAAVLGANDGIISTASLLLGVMAANASMEVVLLTGVAGLIAGAMSMAAGEYVSVKSQSDAEAADLQVERRELAEQPDYELTELAMIYQERGLDEPLSWEVARQLTRHDALGAHARDELGINHLSSARPVLATIASGLSFISGAVLPLLVVVVAPVALLEVGLWGATLVFLGGLGFVAARLGGMGVKNSFVPALRVTFWGGGAMALTTVVGSFFA